MVANFDIWNHQNKHSPTQKGSRPYFNSSALHIHSLCNPGNDYKRPKLLTYREETKQPRRPITDLPAPLVLSSAGKLIRYLHGSYLLPYRSISQSHFSCPDSVL